MIVIHHNKDLDGFSSGAICKYKYPKATLVGWDYAEPLPNFKQFENKEVIMVDVTFPIEKIVELAKIVKHLTIIDHHISFKKEFDKFDPEYILNSNITYIYELGVAACEVAWKYFFPSWDIPYAITLLGRYDTWRQAEGYWDNETLPFQYYLRTVCTSAETFDNQWLFTSDPTDNIIENAVDKGKIIIQYQEQQDMLACKRSSFEIEAFGLKAICLNARAFSSNTLKTVYNKKQHDIMIGFEYTGNSRWSVSLRSDKPEIDCSVIAKSKGGGGHKAAAGFEVDSFDKIFTNG